MPGILVLSAGSPPPDAFVAAQWLARALTGPLGTGLATIAVAWFGFGMLSGRLRLRRGALLVLGCFIFFGAAGLAQAFHALARQTGAGSAPPAPAVITVAPPQASAMLPDPDPYAGASVPN